MAPARSTSSPAGTSSASKPSSKSVKSKLVVTLRLPSEVLSKFSSDLPSSKPSNSKSNVASSPASSDPTSTAPPAAEPSPSAHPSDSNATPVPQAAANNNNLLAPPPNPVKRKGIPGPKPGMKRTNSQLAIDSVPKPRGKPGPKKKPRLGEANGVSGAPAPAVPKLGPKANQGAINEKLRALDRSGKPCRKWQRKGFQIKSFTGVAWDAPTWGTWNKFTNADFAGEAKSDSSNSPDLKATPDSPDDKSASGRGADTPVQPAEPESSPAPAIAIVATS